LPDQFSSILPYVLLGTGAGILGSVIALFWEPKAKARSAVQHFAAGAVLAAVASNIVPEVERIGTLTGIIIGFITGGLIRIGLKWIVVQLERKERQSQNAPVGLAAAAALIYLIAEELLVETIQAEESIFSTLMLFSGFLVLLVLKLLG
jgi:ZIP family zinc transporter